MWIETHSVLTAVANVLWSSYASPGKTVAAMDVLVPKVGELIGGSQREERLDVRSQFLRCIMCFIAILPGMRCSSA